MVGLRKTSKLAAEIPLSLIPRKHAKSMHVTNMATEYVGDDFLPDLPDEISGEQLAFQQKVFRSNEAFKKANNDIMLWFKSPPERRKYPKSRLKNKNAFHKHIKKYSYNSERGSCRIKL